MSGDDPTTPGEAEDVRSSGDSVSPGTTATPRSPAAADSTSPVMPTRSSGGALLHGLREFLLVVAIALVASTLLRAFVVQAFFVPSGSMLPAIQLNDRILVNRINTVERGEVIVFQDPGGWLSAEEQPAKPGPVRTFFEWVGVLPDSGHGHLVKRTLGLPGDHVICCDTNGFIRINGQPINERDYLLQDGGAADNVSFDVVVPEDSVFVLGDHRYVSGDSSRHLSPESAFIPMDLIVGRAVAVVWPTGDAHRLPIPDAFENVPAGQTPPERGVVNTVGGVSE